jgi:hypothetical protein
MAPEWPAGAGTFRVVDGGPPHRLVSTGTHCRMTQLLEVAAHIGHPLARPLPVCVAQLTSVSQKGSLPVRRTRGPPATSTSTSCPPPSTGYVTRTLVMSQLSEVSVPLS